jgi:RNA polymerase sigma-70 factor (ECF subfamily)
MARLRDGDPDAAREVCRRFGDDIRVVIRRHLDAGLRTQFDSVDFAQDVWATLLTAPPGQYVFETPAALRAFLARVARDKVIDAARHWSAARAGGPRVTTAAEGRQTALDEVPSSAPQPSELAIAGELWEQLLSLIPASHRMVAERMREGYTYDEIASMTRISTRTIRRISQRLKELARPDYPPP